MGFLITVGNLYVGLHERVLIVSICPDFHVMFVGYLLALHSGGVTQLAAQLTLLHQMGAVGTDYILEVGLACRAITIDGLLGIVGHVLTDVEIV